MFLKTFIPILLLCYIGTVLCAEERNYCHKEVDCTRAKREKPDIIDQLKNKARYDFTRIYKVSIKTLLQQDRLKDFANYTDVVFLMDHLRMSDTEVNVFVPANKVGDFENLMKTYSFKFSVVNYNFQMTINDNLEGLIYEYATNRFFDWEHYFNIHAIYSWMDEIVLKYPTIAEVIDIGEAADGNLIKGVRLDFTEGSPFNNSAVVIEGGIYADQWITTATATFFINKLLTSNDYNIRKMAAEFTWIIFPTINPDGYEYTMSSDRMWRKNRSYTNICNGVNLNRNFPIRWKTIDPIENPCHRNFQGPHAGSELETTYYMSYLRANKEKDRIRTYIALHSGYELVLYPYSSQLDPVRNKAELASIAYKAKISVYEANNQSMYESGSTYNMLNPYSGSSLDWAYDYLKLPVTLTLELPGPHNDMEEFFVPASKIEPTANNAFIALMQILNDATDFGYYNLKHTRTL